MCAPIRRDSRPTLRNLNSILCVCEDVFETVLSSIAEVNPIRTANVKDKLTLSIALAAAALTLSFLPNIYASEPESDSDDRFNDIPGA